MSNRFLFIVTSIIGPFYAGPAATAFAQAPDRPYVIIGYVTGHGWTKGQIEARKLTHINYAFAIPTPNGELAPLRASDANNLASLTSLKTVNKNLRVLISIGGWGGCRYFSDASLTETSRRKFANSAVTLLKAHQLNGVDIDWEYPDQIGENNIFRPEDRQNYTLLLKALRDRLDEQGKADHRTGANHYLLTAATGADTAFVNHTELGNAQRYLDYVNIMTYDLYHGNDKTTGHHSNLAQSAKGPHARNSAEDAVAGHIRAGVPAGKIVLGLPFYGRGWAGVADKDNGLYQPAMGNHSFISYDELAANYINKNGYTRYWDNDAKAPYLWNPTTHTFISYADEESFAYKIAYVKKQRLAGVMFWEYSHDLQQKKLLNKLMQGILPETRTKATESTKGDK